jgi:glycosyltransferase involved in cell wall biosynthesis
LKTLTIISEVFIKDDGTETIDRSFNIIINEYSKHFERINIIGPGIKDFKFKQGKNPKLFFISTTLYAKPLKKRISYYLQLKKAKKYFKAIIQEGNSDIVQIRIPSLFSMVAYSVVKDLKLPLTTYIAGEWESSFVANYKFFGNTIVAKLLDNSQKKIIRNSIPVSAGPEIAEIYKKENLIYPYFSTTHKEALKIKKQNNILQLLFVGRLERIKRVEDAILALKLLLEKSISAEFHIVGDGVEKENIKKFIVQNNLSNYVTLHGHISDTKILEDLYKKSDLFILPSVSEGTPKVIAEAMSYGAIPIAVRDTGSIRYIIDNKKNGFLVDSYAPEQIALNIELISKSKELKETMQNYCYEYAKEHTIIKEVENMWKHIFYQMEHR